MKKYLNHTSVTDNKEATEYTLLAGCNEFTVVISNKRERRRLTIPYTDFCYPQFITQPAVEEELKERIEKFFSEESKNKAILISYSVSEETRIKQIIKNNKLEYDL